MVLIALGEIKSLLCLGEKNHPLKSLDPDRDLCSVDFTYTIYIHTCNLHFRSFTLLQILLLEQKSSGINYNKSNNTLEDKIE